MTTATRAGYSKEAPATARTNSTSPSRTNRGHDDDDGDGDGHGSQISTRATATTATMMTTATTATATATTATRAGYSKEAPATDHGSRPAQRPRPPRAPTMATDHGSRITDLDQGHGHGHGHDGHPRGLLQRSTGHGSRISTSATATGAATTATRAGYSKEAPATDHGSRPAPRPRRPR
ncbi:hypothetical protein [Arthrobacter sp. HLT1-20]